MYSPNAVTEQLKCPDGTYTDTKENGSCKLCTKGNYCYSTSPTVGPTSETPCPEGFYCPDETPHFGRYPCDIGTYGH